MNTDIADKAQGFKRIDEAELQYDPADDREEEGESEFVKDELQEVLPAPSFRAHRASRCRIIHCGSTRGQTSAGLDFTRASGPVTGRGC